MAYYYNRWSSIGDIRYVFYSFIEWLPGIDTDSAKWVLSTQAQSTAAILGLLIASTVFRLHSISIRDHTLREFIFPIIKSTANFKEKINAAFEDYLILVKSKKESIKRKELKPYLINLGRFWVLNELSSNIISSIAPPRFLTYGNVRQLRDIDQDVEYSAVNIWERYFTRPSDFILEILEAFTFINNTSIEESSQNDVPDKEKPTNSGFGNNHDVINQVLSQISYEPERFEADRLKTARKFLPVFYTTCIILFFAVFLGFLGISGINNPNASNLSYTWLVGLPVGLSSLGLLFSLVSVLRMIR